MTKKILIIVLVAAIGTVSFLRFGTGHAAIDTSSAIRPGNAGYCLDNNHGKLTAGNTVDIWSCNNSPAQVWRVDGFTIKQSDNWCLAAPDNGIAPDSPATIQPCNDNPTQVWLRDSNGYFNPAYQKCLSTSGSGNGSNISVSGCSGLATAAETWQVAGANASITCSGSEGQKVACYAEREWTVWQSGKPSHETLLNAYTDGTPYEAWCADFVSYVYKEAGYPFTQAFDGWDENSANNIQADTGFIEHPADGSYLPKPGDIGYFNYSGGHVEIVISGGKSPTFIYGNSGIIDPSTGNGQMMTNTKRSDGSQGQLLYYLSPN